jgi:hypothetical protein
MIVIEKNGQRTVVTGWRAWLLAIGVTLSAVALLGALAFVFLGMALTVGAVMLVVLPLAIIAAIAGSLFGRRG